MSKTDFIPGSTGVGRFWDYINERYRIQRRKSAGESPPWTDDPILQIWSFTNVFREWDRGTLALHDMLRKAPWWDEGFFVRSEESRRSFPNLEQQIAIARNICVYRLWNLADHAYEYGWIEDLDDFIAYIRQRRKAGVKVFTSAYLTTSMGVAGIDKAELYIRACKEIWNGVLSVSCDSVQDACIDLQDNLCVGPFVAQEMVRDLRYIRGLLGDAADADTYALAGPGAYRGLQRLGLPASKREAPSSMRDLWELAPMWLGDELQNHHPICTTNPEYPFFDVHAVEFCLCELDKYERTRSGEGKPRRKYRTRKSKDEQEA